MYTQIIMVKKNFVHTYVIDIFVDFKHWIKIADSKQETSHINMLIANCLMMKFNLLRKFPLRKWCANIKSVLFIKI